MKPLDCRNSAISDKTCPPKGLLPIPKKSRTIKTDKPRPFLCPICTRGFSRQEHLKRHQRSHTNEKPFLCAFCGRCFARRDLVLRHQQKLCAALNDQEKRQQLVGKHIIRRPGNKETVLPTPQNPLAHVLAVENKKERAAGQRSLSAAPGHVPKVKVQGSLSAPTILTCFPERDDRNNVKTEFADTPLQSNVPSTREPLTRTAVTESGFSDVAGPPTSLSVLPYYEKSCDCMECPETSCGQAYATVLNPEYNGQATAQFTLNECFVNSGAYSPPNADVPQPLTYVPQPNPYYFSYKAPNFPIERTEQEDSLEPIGHMGPVDTAESTLSRNHDITEMANTLYMPVKQVANQKPMEYWGSYNLPLTSVPSSTFTPVVSTETSVTVSNQSFVNNTVPIFQNVPQAQQVSEDAVGRANSSTDFFTLSEKHDFNSFEKDPDEPLSGVMSGTKKLGGSRLSFFTPQLHDYIISDNNLEGIAFPTIAELDWYVSMYQNEFHGSLPFVHLHSIVPSVDVYPLLLAVAVIGALHRSHLQQAKLLYNVTRFRIWKLMAQPQCGGMPIWVAQALALLAFFGLFSGDRSVSGTLEADLATLVDIVKRYRLNIPFEAVCEPPVDAEGALEFQTAEHVERIYDYFLEAQSRIRTCHTVLMLTVVFTSITGRKGSFFSTDLQCGVPCFQEELFLTENYREWWRLLDKHHIVIDSKEALLYLSNGGQSYCECLSYLINGPTVYVAENKKTSFETMFSLLVSIHEKICEERLAIQERGESAQQDDIWSKPSSPTVESLLRLWEDLYIKNCGVLVAKRSNLHCFITNPALRVIYLTLFLARIHKCICVSNVIKYIWKSDWEGMNKALDVSVRDPVLVHEVASYALDTMNFWLDLMHASQDNPKLGILNTPIIATICVFCSILVLVEYLKWAEDWARKRTICKDASDNHNAFDKSIWLKCKRLIDRLEGYLTSKSNSAYHYVDNMHVGPFNGNSAPSQITHSSHDHAATDGDNAAQMVLKAQISNTVPYLGIRLLTESYIWPIALDFAHALRARAMHNLPKQV